MSKRQIIVVLMSGLLSAAGFSAHIEYDVIPIITEDPYNPDAGATLAGINSKGHIAGHSWYYGGFFWSQESGYVSLELPPNQQTQYVYALNEQDQIAGAINSKAAIWNSSGTVEALGILPDERESRFTDINDKGTAVGIIRGHDYVYQVVVQDQNSNAIFIDYPGELRSFPIINNHRQIAACFDGQLFTWEESTGWTQLQLPTHTEYHRLLDIDDANNITAALKMTDGSSCLPQTYLWDAPDNPQKTPVNYTDINQYGQYLFNFSNLNFFFDGQYLFSFDDGLPSFRYLYTWDETNDFARQTVFKHQFINDHGQIVSLSVEPPAPYLFNPIGISFDDPVLSEAIAMQLELDREPNYLDVLNMTVLDANSLGITSLGGLEYAANLQWLDVRNNPLDKRSVCYTLEFLRRRDPNITILYDRTLYSDCAVEFGDPRVKAAVETKLGIRDPNFFDMHTSRLNTLYLSQIDNLSGLEHAPYLNTVWVQTSTVSDPEPIKELMGLQFLLFENNKALTDAAFIRNLILLQKLVLAGCSISDIRCLLNLYQLSYLDLHDNPIDPRMSCEVLPQVRQHNPDAEIRFPIPDAPIQACSSDLVSIWHLSDWWLRCDCRQETNWCQDTDIIQDGCVNLADLSYVAYFWLHEDVYW